MSNFRSALAIFLLFSSNAYAAEILWAFNNVVFDDGATLNGSFTMSDVNPSGYELFSEFQGSLSGGNLSDIEYVQDGGGGLSTDPEAGSLFTLRLFEYGPVANLTGSRVLEIAIVGDLFSAGEITLSPNYDYYPYFTPQPGLAYAYNREAFCGNQGCGILDTVLSHGGQTGRTLVSGSIVGTVVPVPAAVWLFSSALMGLSLIRRRGGS